MNNSEKHFFLVEKIEAMGYKEYSDEEIEKLLEELNSIYSDGFRHYYSNFFQPVLNAYKAENDLSILTVNLGHILSYLEHSPKEYEYKEKIEKFCDHVNIECCRVEQFMRLQSQFKDAEKVVKELSNKSKETSDKLSDATNKLEKSQIDIITAISIFSAIILAFFGGFEYITAAIAAIKDAPLLHVLLCVEISGGIVANVVFILFRFLLSVLKRDFDTHLNKGIIVFDIVLGAVIITTILSKLFCR